MKVNNLRLSVLLSLTLLTGLGSVVAVAAEKVYLHIDRPVVTTGENLWFRGFIASDDGMSASRFIYVELLNETAGTVESRVKIREEDSLLAGYIAIPEGLSSGSYTVRAYTLAQLGMPVEEMFHSRIYVRGKGRLSVPSVQGRSADTSGFRIALTPVPGGLGLRLTDGSGSPVEGDFSVSILSAGSEKYDSAASINENMSAAFSIYDEGDREMAQSLGFNVATGKRKTPDSYYITAFAPAIGYYESVNAPGSVTDVVIPGLDFAEGTDFTFNASGAKGLSLFWKGETFAEPFNYSRSYSSKTCSAGAEPDEAEEPAGNAELQDVPITVFEPSTDTLDASIVSAAARPAFYKPRNIVGPYSSVFEWRQVKLREELQRYDDMDLMTYIAANYPSMIVLDSMALAAERTMVTTRSSSIRMTVTHGQVVKSSAGYNPVELYINGFWQPDWSEASTLTVSKVENLYVLRGTEAALYKANAVVLLELRRMDTKRASESVKKDKATLTISPLGYQKHLPFQPQKTRMPGLPYTIYWNPSVRTKDDGRATLPASIPSGEGVYVRIEGCTSDGRWVSVRGGFTYLQLSEV